MSIRCLKISILLLAAIGIATTATAKPMRYLVKYKDGTPTSQLATKWTKVEGGYEFSLDTTLEVSKGKTVNAEMVKASIEKRLKRKGMSIETEGEDKLKISFSGDEEKFWKTLARARIKASKVQIAMENNGSSGGIRANTIARKPKEGEVRGSFISADRKKQQVEVFIYSVGPDGIPAAIKPSKTLRIKTTAKDVDELKKDDVIYFRPIRLDGDAWSVKEISLK